MKKRVELTVSVWCLILRSRSRFLVVFVLLSVQSSVLFVCLILCFGFRILCKILLFFNTLICYRILVLVICSLHGIRGTHLNT